MSEISVEDWVRCVAEAGRPLLRENSPHAWLIEQSMHTHFQRLVPILSLSCFQTLTGSILDVGAGTGAMALDLAWRAGRKGFVTALDSDGQALKITQKIAQQVGVEIAALAGEAAALPLKDASQDMTVARFMFQHLRAPSAVIAEMRRVTRPGGRVVIIDIDDEVVLSEPAEEGPMREFRKAIGILQSNRGGNRLIGRKLYRLMREAGLEAIQVMVIPFVRQGLQNGRSPELEAFKIKRMLRERRELIDSGIMSAQAFEAALAELKHGFAEDRFEMHADFVAAGLVPAL